MIKWLKKIFKKMFSKKVELLEEPKRINIINDDKTNFKILLKQQANPEQDDGSGYKIIKRLKLEEMI